MKFKKIKIEIEIPEEKTLSDGSRDNLENLISGVIDEIVETYSIGDGLVGSGYNFITDEHDYKLEVGFTRSYE